MKRYENLLEHLGDKASFFLDYVSEKITKDELQLPYKNIVDRVFINSNRNPQALRSLHQLSGHGNLKDPGY